jgi:hypothetical protein
MEPPVTRPKESGVPSENSKDMLPSEKSPSGRVYFGYVKLESRGDQVHLGLRHACVRNRPPLRLASASGKLVEFAEIKLSPYCNSTSHSPAMYLAPVLCCRDFATPETAISLSSIFVNFQEAHSLPTSHSRQIDPRSAFDSSCVIGRERVSRAVISGKRSFLS